ncbi:hypothetical protein MRX96_004236 [Rhipicephalus microplus]
MSTKKVCIVGAGPSGLACARQMLDYGFDVVLYERSAELGGLWVYHDDDVEGRASVMRTTVINTSKEMSAFRYQHLFIRLLAKALVQSQDLHLSRGRLNRAFIKSCVIRF